MNLPTIKKALLDLTQVQARYRNLGAQDTEADAKLQQVIYMALCGKLGGIYNLTADDLELFTSSFGKEYCDQAADEISDFLRGVVEAIRASKIGDMEEIGKYLRDYCWRITMYEGLH